MPRRLLADSEAQPQFERTCLKSRITQQNNRAPDLRKQLAEQGYESAGNSPEQFAEYIKTEIAKWTRVISAAGLKAE